MRFFVAILLIVIAWLAFGVAGAYLLLVEFDMRFPGEMKIPDVAKGLRMGLLFGPIAVTEQLIQIRKLRER